MNSTNEVRTNCMLNIYTHIEVKQTLCIISIIIIQFYLNYIESFLFMPPVRRTACVCQMTMTMIFISLRPLAEYEISFSLKHILVEHLVTIHRTYIV